MKILSIETATEACSAALYIDGQVTEEFEVCPRQHSQKILKMCQNLLESHQIELSQLDAIAVGQGPGSFTGVRLGLCVAQGLAFGVNLPVIPISTLQAVSWGAIGQSSIGPEYVLCAMDARQGQVYFAGFKLDTNGFEVVIPERVIAPENIEPLPEVFFDSKVLACGHGFCAYSEALKARLECNFVATLDDALPHAKDIAHLAAFKFQRGDMVQAVDVRPSYLRNEVVHT